ncbi:MAG: hypothetical protein JWM21_3227 [Acidobacteria bacterium]|nr:hypothetical protein [Acidobacteriota bacterium]
MSIGFPGRKTAWLTLLVVTLIGLAIVLAPVWIIQPFKPQSPRGLAWSYVMRSWSPLVTIVCSLLALALLVYLWRGTRRWWRKAALVAIILPLLAVTWLARQNHFEWMFHPLPNAAYARLPEAGFVADADMVMTIRNKGEAVAYPIRLMAYHHVVQDTVGGTPVVATY